MSKVNVNAELSSIKVQLAALKKSITALSNTANLVDGTTIKYDSLAIGESVLKVVDGNSIVLGDGEYQIEGGATFTISDGVISKVEGKETEEVEAEEAKTDDVVAEEKAEEVTEEIQAVIEEAIKEALEESTPENLSKLQKFFAVGTPEQRITNLEIIVKALFEYNFGWKIREAEREAQETAAIATYQANFSKQEKQLAELTGIVEQLVNLEAGTPISGAVGFSKQPKTQTQLSGNSKTNTQVDAINRVLYNK